MKHTIEGYRFAWHSSFHGDAAVQVNRGEKGATVEWSLSSFTYGSGRYWRGIDPAAWNELEAAVLAANFWALEAELEFDFGIDGADWLFEGRRREIYRFAKRWSPDGPLYDLGRVFCEIAGPPIANIRLY